MTQQTAPRFTLLKVLIVISIVWSMFVAILLFIFHYYPEAQRVLSAGLSGQAKYTITAFGLFSAFFRAPFDVFNLMLTIALVPISVFVKAESVSLYKPFLIQPMALTMFAATTWGAYKFGVSKHNYAAFGLILVGLGLYGWYLARLLQFVVAVPYWRLQYEWENLVLVIPVAIVLLVHFMLWRTAWKWYQRGVTQNVLS